MPDPTARTPTRARASSATDAPESNGLARARPPEPAFQKRTAPDRGEPGWRIYTGDCRDLLPRIDECARAEVDLIFADPPFNWKRGYDRWDDDMPELDYCDATDATRPLGESRAFTGQWLDACVRALAPHGTMWVNIPDTWAAEIVVHLKARGLHMVNWCVWHYRFGQNTRSRFINSKVHALYFCKDPATRVWNPEPVLELSDRRSTYFDPRTESKRDGMPPGKRVPMDVWYGKYWGRIQGNNLERRHAHDNQLPEVYLERVLRACSNKDDLILDPFTGSGTTGVVAHEWGRRFIGVEFSEEMAQSAAERIQAGMVRRDALAESSSAIFPARNRRPAPRDRLPGDAG